ncbi:MAG TPA: hypothetical protein VGQ99_21015, partial [Tepidisphaeraceae bacterium]|nr:hypothetical protein [Tepidisphaeraceae bacterium]
ADAEENGYLNGLSYQLAGGGWLRPSYAGEALAGAEDVGETAAMAQWNTGGQAASGTSGMPPGEEVFDPDENDPLAGG